MARFVYRLQKVYELRERKKKEQERKVQAAMERVARIEAAIQAKKNEIRLVRQNMFTAPAIMLETHDLFLQKLGDELEQLKQELILAQQQLEYEKKMLVKAQMDLEALVKHKEKAYEEYLEEEKAIDMRRLDEVAGQRYFRKQQADLLEEQEDLDALEQMQLMQEMEGYDY